MLREKIGGAGKGECFNSHQRGGSGKSPTEDQGVLITWAGVMSEATRKDGEEENNCHPATAPQQLSTQAAGKSEQTVRRTEWGAKQDGTKALDF